MILEESAAQWNIWMPLTGMVFDSYYWIGKMKMKAHVKRN